MAHGSHEHAHHAKMLPADLSAPAFVSGWQKRALTVGVVFTILGAVLAVLAATANHDGINHLMRSYLMGFMICLGFTLGGMAFLMVQYLSGGKWGLLLRRPLEAMSRTLPLVFLMFIPIGLGLKKLYLWAAVSNVGDALRSGFINREQAHAIAWKRPMLSIPSVWIQILICFAIWFGFVYILNKWGLQRDADPEHRYSFWQKRFENVSGVGVVLYALTLTVVSIDLVMSLNITWFSTMYGLMFLVGQGYAVLALAVITVVRLSRRRTIQDDPEEDGTARPGQALLCLYHAEYLPGLLAVPDYLVGQPARKRFPGTWTASAADGVRLRRWISFSTGSSPSRYCFHAT